MRVDRVIVDWMRTLKQAVQALDNNITVSDNFGASGVPEGWTILSQGPKKIPKWGPADGLRTSTDHQAVGTDGVDGTTGATGLPGTAASVVELPIVEDIGHWEPMAFDCEVLFNSECDIVLGWVNTN